MLHSETWHQDHKGVFHLLLHTHASNLSLGSAVSAYRTLCGVLVFLGHVVGVIEVENADRSGKTSGGVVQQRSDHFSTGSTRAARRGKQNVFGGGVFCGFHFTQRVSVDETADEQNAVAEKCTAKIFHLSIDGGGSDTHLFLQNSAETTLGIIHLRPVGTVDSEHLVSLSHLHRSVVGLGGFLHWKRIGFVHQIS